MARGIENAEGVVLVFICGIVVGICLLGQVLRINSVVEVVVGAAALIIAWVEIKGAMQKQDHD